MEKMDISNQGLLENQPFCGVDAAQVKDSLEGEQKSGVSPETVKAAAELGLTVAQYFAAKKGSKTEMEIAIKAACKRKPLFGKKKKEEWQECSDKVVQSLTPQTPTYSAPPVEDKVLGMPKGAGIAVAIIGSLALAAGLFFGIRYFVKQGK